MVNDEYFISLAIDKAWERQLLTYPNPAVGSAIVKNNSIISLENHKEAGKPHAEVEAIKSAYYQLSKDKKILKLENSIDIHNYLYKNHNNLFTDATIYVTLEPCNHYGKTPPCSKLIEELKFKRVVIATADLNPKASGGANRLKKSGIDVKIGILQKEAKELLYPFLKWSKDKFIFFKLAQSLNGVTTGGYISSKESLKFVHKLRDKIDLLAIGGETVRVDRPTLDTRFIKNGKNPNILIYSRKKEKDFDKTIPLFKIKSREVFIRDNLKELENSNFIMIEGGINMLELAKDIVDLTLIFVAPKYIKRDPIKSNIEFEYLKVLKSDVDLKIFSKIK